jgi:hypothetical protein
MTDNAEFFFPELNPAEDGIIPMPPEQMRFLELRAEPVLDNGPLRLRVYIDVTAFQQRPYIDVTLTGADGHEIASANIIEPMSRKNVFTMHVRGQQQSGSFALKARLFYPEHPDSDTREFTFEI